MTTSKLTEQTTLPLLPLRDVVVFPHMVIPLFVGRPKSIKALEAAMEAGRQIMLVAEAALVIYWRELDRQIRVRGSVERLSAADSDAYFASRPHDSRVASSISPQSRPIERAAWHRLLRPGALFKFQVQGFIDDDEPRDPEREAQPHEEPRKNRGQ